MNNVMALFNWTASSEFVSSSIPSWQILTAHAQPFWGARDLAFCLKVPLDSLLVWASSGGSGETARMRRLAWTFAARIGDKYQIRLTWSNYSCTKMPIIYTANICKSPLAPSDTYNTKDKKTLYFFLVNNITIFFCLFKAEIELVLYSWENFRTEKSTCKLNMKAVFSDEDHVPPTIYLSLELICEMSVCPSGVSVQVLSKSTKRFRV